MKRLITLLLALLTVIMVSLPRPAQACNLSELVYDSLVPSGSNYILYVTLCIGTGRTGTEFGGDQNTGRFEFGFFDSNPGFSILAVTPSTVTPALHPSTSSYRTAGPQCPPAPNPFGFDCRVTYTPVTPGLWFGCIISTVTCGDTARQCFQFSFTMNQIPDTLRAYGIEGGNSSTNGCFPDADMAVDLSSLPVVWGTFAGSPQDGGVDLNWVTANDHGTSNYVITRSLDGSNFTEIGSIPAKGTDDSKYGNYNFFDAHPEEGVNYYRLVQMNEAGVLSSSEVVQIIYTAPSSSQWNFVSPVPSQDFVTMSFRSPKDQQFTLQVMDTKGSIVHSRKMDAQMGTTEEILDMTQWNSGFYFLRLVGDDGSVLEKKVVKL